MEGPKHMTSLSNNLESGYSFNAHINSARHRHTQKRNQSAFKSSKEQEFKELMERNVFQYVKESDAEGHRMYVFRFVDSLKNKGMPNVYEKSRWVVQAYNDLDHGFLVYAPTVQRVSQQILLIICAMDQALCLPTRDVSQAYVLFETKIQRPRFVRPPDSLNFHSKQFCVYTDHYMVFQRQ